MKELTQERKALKSLFKHLKDGGFSIKALEPQGLEDDDDILPITKDTSFETIFDYYFEWDDDHILTVEKEGKSARILQTWYGGTEGLYSNASVPKEIFDDLEKATESWWDEMEEQDIQF